MSNQYDKNYFLTIEKNYLARIDKIRFYTIVEIIRKIKPKVVLDAGCGSGDYIVRISPYVEKIYGTDFTEVACKISKEKTKQLRKVKIEKMDLTKKLFFKNSYFDFILCTEVLEHLKDNTYILSELKRVLKSDGLILLTMPNFTFLSVEYLREKIFNKDPTHYHRYSLNEWSKLVSKFFKILEMKTITHYPTIVAFYLGLKGNAISVDKISGKIPIMNKMGRDILLLCQNKKKE
jgi:ubiquinone/menaquinone biosynthesis C-methylase UbiE